MIAFFKLIQMQMQTNQEFYFSVGISDIPWDRIINWYGRSSDFPYYFYDILSDDPERQKIGVNKIGITIEHQDGIIMATPFALIFLFRLFLFDKVNKKSILEKILIVTKATKFQFSFYRDKEIPTDIPYIYQLLEEKYIWPSFIDENQDDIYWEEYDYSAEHYFWLKYTIDIIRTFSFAFKNLDDEAEIDIANKILNTINEI